MTDPNVESVRRLLKDEAPPVGAIECAARLLIKQFQRYRNNDCNGLRECWGMSWDEFTSLCDLVDDATVALNASPRRDEGK